MTSTVESLKKEIEEKEKQIKQQQHDLEEESVRKIIKSGIIKTRHWKVAQFLRDTVSLQPAGKNPEWPELARMLPESAWWYTFDICEGAKLHRFNDAVRLSLAADVVVPLIASLGITIEHDTIREQIESAEHGVIYEQNRINVLTAIENICVGKSRRTYTKDTCKKKSKTSD